MQIPYRKPGKYSQQKADPYLTQDAYNVLVKKLKKLKEVSRPETAQEVARLAELGDFSENAEYQLAKGKLRGINNAILRLEAQINSAIIIQPKTNSNVVELGSTVTVDCGGTIQSFTILGSSQTDPARGVISHNSPLGSALIGACVGQEITVKTPQSNRKYRIIKIS